ncbi:proline dehydrogenase family protein [Serinibacter arcticus]|uniref:L-glutamate gamma-semialdehyde dehydrogenase n=1 Tax=Serinibacter arcticus TaxID=1655435 RepID=A0A4Z1E6Q6_9MICO|nr:bifunctional proline dehydrogenase/L-glutamate gamma-semialdehyde dehydrogenase [Serinibacter arcticus]TGO06143.1 Proline dehydrogenase [Serinibacter arcticus]
MTTATGPTTLHDLVPAAIDLARRWAAAEGEASENAASERLGQLVADRAGLDLAVAFVDKVARPEDTGVAARELAALPAHAARSFLTPSDAFLLGVGQRVARLAPSLVVPLARMRLRQLVGHLVVDASDAALTAHLARSRVQGYRLNINLLGEAVLGEREAASRVARSIALVGRDDVDYVSIKVSSLVSQISTWDTPGTVARVLERLRPLYRAALRGGAFVNLDMEEYRDLDLTMEVFETLLREEEFADLEAGIVLQAYLPDAPAALERLIDLATARVAAGGARLKVRLVKGANLAMERVESQLHGWPVATHASKADTDATYVRMLERALRPDVAPALRLGVAGHNLYHLALAHLLAQARGVGEAMDVEMLQGMAPAQARAVRDTVGSVLLYTPVVARADFDVAVSYLVRRLEENASPENYLHQSTAEGGQDEARARFEASVREAAGVTTAPHRRGEPLLQHGAEVLAFDNAPDGDPAVASVREAARAALARGDDGRAPRAAHLSSRGEVDAVVGRARGLAAAWAATGPEERVAVLADVANRLEAARTDLLAVMAHEAGKTVGEADPEISEAIDFARWYAGSAASLADAGGDELRFDPVAVTLVTPPWNFPVAIAVGGVLAALAAGSAVAMKPSPLAARCGETVASHVRDALAAAGHDADLVQIVQVPEDEVGRHLVAHDGVDQVVLTGSLETAELFAGWRAGRRGSGGPRVFAETSGKNTLIVTPSADLDLAVADVVRSAFGHAGQKCSAASLVILVGSVGRSRRFHDQLLDAVTSLRVGVPDDLGTGMGPVIERPGGKLLRALTTLEPGETWAVEPREVAPPGDGGGAWAGRLWSPGVRAGVAPGSWFHLTECFGPVLGVMRADTLEEAIAWQNAVPFGLTGGLHSLDPAEIELWLSRVEVGNAYVNRHITGAVVQRQPFGGWKGSSMGPGSKAGGPTYVAQLGRWVDGDGGAARATRAGLGDAEIDLAVVGAADDAWAGTALVGTDEAALPAEENRLRYVPVPSVTVRVAAGASRWDLMRVLNAATGTLGIEDVAVSVAGGAEGAAGAAGAGAEAVTFLEWRGESDGAFAARVRSGGVERVRWIGGASDEVGAELWEASIDAGVTVLDAPVVASSAVEMLTLVREQAISRTRHRFGHLTG